ncbi:Protein alcS [Ceratocystis fimbriata CBS 114723]|uniref:Protein alcS n=1 Tax=Ceratocystis fimbriata CBS 114723 TaxID=1035309 RepID=A0A2C5WTW1_9PEZI|nr:Protein alcS [Ceratocystis fimbriata CBS 114723]
MHPHSHSSHENLSDKPSVEKHENMDHIDHNNVAKTTGIAHSNGNVPRIISNVNGNPLEHQRTYGSINISPEMFEELYLAPKNRVAGQLRQTYGNPTPVAIGGFVLTTTPLSMALLGWQGAGGLVAPANVGTYLWLGGLLLLLGGVGEWLLGNTFPCTVFMTFGGFWLTVGTTLIPEYGAYTSYATDPSNPASGAANPMFFATFGFFLVCMTILSFVFMIASMRVNFSFFMVFFTLVFTFSCLTGSFFRAAQGHSDLSLKLQHVGAGFLFATSMFGWWIFFGLVLSSVDFPISLPMGDLSTVFKGKADRAKTNIASTSTSSNGDSGSDTVIHSQDAYKKLWTRRKKMNTIDQSRDPESGTRAAEKEVYDKEEKSDPRRNSI